MATVTDVRAADTLIWPERKTCPPWRGDTLEENDRQWRGSPLDMGGSTMDAYGIKEVVLEFDNGDEDVFRPRMREEFGSYELHMMAAYLDSIAHSIRKGQKN
jgi:hypothetical protein